MTYRERSVLQEAEAIAAADEESVQEIRKEDPRVVVQEEAEEYPLTAFSPRFEVCEIDSNTAKE